MATKDLNKVQIIGRLGKDVEMRYTQAGKAVSTFSVASGRSWKNADGETQEETEWFNVVAWEKLGEICNQYLTKGSRVYIEGRLATRNYEKDGVTHYRTELVAADMIMLDSKPAESNSKPTERPQAASRPAATKPAARNVPQGVVTEEDLPF